jgi:hypothetical protein
VPKYPQIKVKLSGQDGNAFFILGVVTRALKNSMVVPADEIQEFLTEAKSGDYHKLLATCMEWVDVT